MEFLCCFPAAAQAVLGAECFLASSLTLTHRRRNKRAWSMFMLCLGSCISHPAASVVLKNWTGGNFKVKKRPVASLFLGSTFLALLFLVWERENSGLQN